MPARRSATVYAKSHLVVRALLSAMLVAGSIVVAALPRAFAAPGSSNAENYGQGARPTYNAWHHVSPTVSATATTPAPTATGAPLTATATTPTPTATGALLTATATVSAVVSQTACPAGNGLFTLYYGYIQNPASTDTTLQAIVRAKPNFVVVGDGLAARSDIPGYLHQSGIRAIQYLPLNYGAASATSVDAGIDTAMQAGYDGMFFDQASTASGVAAYQSARAARVRSYGATKLVIMDPGLVPPDASMFNYADIVSVENGYNQQLPASWGIPAWRWLSVQGDPASQAASSAPVSESRLLTFRGNGGFWYYSSAYASSGATAIALPSWYADFSTWTVQQPGPSCSSAGAQAPTFTPSPMPSPISSPTASPAATNTGSLPSASPTPPNTAIPTVAPPTATNTPPSPPNTAIPTVAPPTATNTPPSPSKTATPTVAPPTATNTPPSPSKTATPTVAPPTATNTPPTPPNTAIPTVAPPTATKTPTPPPASSTPITPTSTGTPVAASVWHPTPGTTWFWEIGATPSLSGLHAVQAYDIDGFDNPASTVATLHANGIRAICYIDAGTYEPGRSDDSLFPAGLKGSAVSGWPGELWLDVRPAGPNYSALKSIMVARAQMCQTKGFDAIEWDNVDSYENSPGFATTASDQITYNTFLATTAHTLGLSAGLKNDVDQVATLQPSFDFSIDEECFKYSECSTETPFINDNKAVFETEYSDDGMTTAQFCPQANSMRFSSALATFDLNGPWTPCWS